jgi:hypothetical protein
VVVEELDSTLTLELLALAVLETLHQLHPLKVTMVELVPQAERVTAAAVVVEPAQQVETILVAATQEMLQVVLVVLENLLQ